MRRHDAEIAQARVVSLPQGALEGHALGDYAVWRGIPYARPPVGELRWRAPAPPERWTGVRAAHRLGPRALQPPEHPADATAAAADGAPPPPQREDCLTLNVCAPAAAPPRDGWPVLVCVHGGGFRTGSGAMFGEGEAFARDGLVVVTFNYRLGALGFLHLGGLFGEHEADAGLCGLLDQIAALRWVREQIGAFGGDPHRVTVYGQSAGAMSIGCLMAAPPARGLFSRAILSSGGADNVADEPSATALARRLLDELGVDDPAALRTLPAREVIAAQERLVPAPDAAWLWRPALHPEALPEPPIERIAAGAAAGIDLLAGNNGDEARLFAELWGPEAVGATARALLHPTFGAAGTERLLAAYRERCGATGAATAALGDIRYGIPTQRLADAHSAHASVWRYRIDVASPGFAAALDGGHTTEIPMVWHGAALGPAVPADEPHAAIRAGAAPSQRARLADAIHAAWTGFVRDGDPAVPGLPDWPRYDPGDRAVMILDDDSHVEHDPRRAERVAWGGRRPTTSPRLRDGSIRPASASAPGPRPRPAAPGSP